MLLPSQSASQALEREQFQSRVQHALFGTSVELVSYPRQVTSGRRRRRAVACRSFALWCPPRPPPPPQQPQSLTISAAANSHSDLQVEAGFGIHSNLNSSSIHHLLWLLLLIHLRLHMCV